MRWSSFVPRLPAERFCRIRRSHIIALGHIERVGRDHVVMESAIAGQWHPREAFPRCSAGIDHAARMKSSPSRRPREAR